MFTKWLSSLRSKLKYSFFFFKASMCAHYHVKPLEKENVSLQSSLERNTSNFTNILLLDVNFGNLNVKLHILIISFMFAEF